MYNIMYETSRQSRFDARYWMLGAGALGRAPPRHAHGDLTSLAQHTEITIYPETSLMVQWLGCNAPNAGA